MLALLSLGILVDRNYLAGNGFGSVRSKTAQILAHAPDTVSKVDQAPRTDSKVLALQLQFSFCILLYGSELHHQACDSKV